MVKEVIIDGRYEDNTMEHDPFGILIEVASELKRKQ